MIERQAAYKVGENIYSSLEEAQTQEIKSITGLTEEQAGKVLANGDDIIKVIRMRPRSRALRPAATPRKKRNAAATVSPNQPASQ